MTSWSEFGLTIAPYLTGGLAGAIFTYFINRRSASKKLRRLAVQKVTVPYTLPKDHRVDNLQIVYEGREQKNVSLFQLTLTNISKNLIPDNPVVIELPDGSRILEQGTLVEPVNSAPLVDNDDLKNNQLRFRFGSLQPGDRLFLWFLLADVSGDVKYFYRGDPEVVLSESPYSGSGTDEDDIRSLAWCACLYTIAKVGFNDVVTAPIQGAILLISVRYIVRLYSRARERSAVQDNPPTVIIRDIQASGGISIGIHDPRAKQFRR